MNEFYGSPEDMNPQSYIEKSAYTEKPWGSETLWAHTANYVGKVLRVNCGEQLSIQYHNLKDETMYVLSGTGFVKFYTLTDNKLELAESRFLIPGDVVYIPPKKIHSVEAITDMEILEASTDHLTDLVRLRDRYNRN